MCGAKFQWGDGENFKDGWATSISKVQFSFKYNFWRHFINQKIKPLTIKEELL